MHEISILLIEDITTDIAETVCFIMNSHVNGLDAHMIRENNQNKLIISAPEFSNPQEGEEYAAQIGFLAGQLMFQELTLARVSKAQKEVKKSDEEKV